MTFRVLFVCTGNICRSPTAEAILRSQAKLLPWLRVDSAGTHAYHLNEPPDSRSQKNRAESRHCDAKLTGATGVCGRF